MERQMRILFVTENMTSRCGANVNILLTLVKRMKVDIVADVLCKENQQRPIDVTKKKLFDGCLSFEFSEGECLTEFQNQHDWRKQGAVKKLMLLLSHPSILRDMIDVKYFDSHRTKRKYVKEIERACEKNRYDAVIGLCAPYYIAQAVAEAKISSIKAIIQLDPYTYNYTMPVFLSSLRKQTEKSVIRKLNHVFAASFVYDELMEKRIADKEKATSFMIPGIVVDEVCSSPQKAKRDNDRINFVFIGQFYDEIRNPKYLLELFCKLPPNFVLHIYGGGADGIVDMYRDKLGERLVHHGWVSSDVAKKQMYDADFLVNVNNTIQNQMASKLFEYIGTGKPIVNICKSRGCPSLKYVSGYENVINIIENEDSQIATERVTEFAKKSLGKTMSRDIVMSAFSGCTDVYVSNCIVGVMTDGTISRTNSWRYLDR